MTVIPNQRKTYMMLSKENQVKFITSEDDPSLIINSFPTVYHTNYQEIEDVVNPGTGAHIRTVTNHDVQNAMYTYKFPDAFINSKNPRWIEVHHCKVVVNGGATQDIILHSDVVQRDAYLDHAIMNVNETRTKYKKYEYTQQEHYFHIWFTSFARPDTAINDANVSFMVEMMLIY